MHVSIAPGVHALAVSSRAVSGLDEKIKFADILLGSCSVVIGWVGCNADSESCKLKDNQWCACSVKLRLRTAALQWEKKMDKKILKMHQCSEHGQSMSKHKCCVSHDRKKRGHALIFLFIFFSRLFVIKFKNHAKCIANYWNFFSEARTLPANDRK